MMTDFNIERWANAFKNAPVEEMTVDMSMIFMQLCMMPSDDERYDELEDQYIYKIASSRAEWMGLNIEKNVLAFICCLCDRPGGVVMYLSLLRFEQHQFKIEKFNMEKFAFLFAEGFPNIDELDTLWDMQKCKGGNGLDLMNWGALV